MKKKNREWEWENGRERERERERDGDRGSMKINRTRSPGVTGTHHRSMRTAAAAIGLCHRLFCDHRNLENKFSISMKTLDSGESRVKKNSPKITARNNTIFLLRFQREKTFVACFRLRDKLDKFYNAAFHLLHNIVSILIMPFHSVSPVQKICEMRSLLFKI